MLAVPSPRYEAMTHHLEELSLQPNCSLPPLDQRRNGEYLVTFDPRICSLFTPVTVWRGEGCIGDCQTAVLPCPVQQVALRLMAHASITGSV